MGKFKNLKLSEKLYYIYGTLFCIIMFFAIPLGVTHEMNPAWGTDIGMKHGIGWILFGLGDVFIIWTLFFMSSTNSNEVKQ